MRPDNGRTITARIDCAGRRPAAAAETAAVLLKKIVPRVSVPKYRVPVPSGVSGVPFAEVGASCASVVAALQSEASVVTDGCPAPAASVTL